jgi:hypothetical protein
MIRQILPNNNERCYSNFSPTFREVNTPLGQLASPRRRVVAVLIKRGPGRCLLQADWRRPMGSCQHGVGEEGAGAVRDTGSRGRPGTGASLKRAAGRVGSRVGCARRRSFLHHQDQPLHCSIHH